MPTHQDSRFHERAAATLSLSERRALYVGPALGVGFHRGGVTCLALALDGNLVVHTKGPTASCSTASALLGAGLRHRIEFSGARVAFLYLDPDDGLVSRLRDEMSATCEPLLFVGHPDASDFASRLQRGERFAAFGDSNRRALDPRIMRTLRQLERDLLAVQGAARVASSLGLSTSRFLHVFRAEVGVPFRRYRIWARLRLAVRSHANGHSWTEAAAESGFASSSHFSDTFRSVFGVAPSVLSRVHLDVETSRLDQPA